MKRYVLSLLLLAALPGCASDLDHVVDDRVVERAGVDPALSQLRGVLDRAENVLDLLAVTSTHYEYRGNMESGLFWSRLLGEKVYYVSITGVRVYSDDRVEVIGDGFGDGTFVIDVLRCANESDASLAADLLMSLRLEAVGREE
jgi:hypothetical protein